MPSDQKVNSTDPTWVFQVLQKRLPEAERTDYGSVVYHKRLQNRGVLTMDMVRNVHEAFATGVGKQKLLDEMKRFRADRTPQAKAKQDAGRMLSGRGAGSVAAQIDAKYKGYLAMLDSDEDRKEFETALYYLKGGKFGKLNPTLLESTFKRFTGSERATLRAQVAQLRGIEDGGVAKSKEEAAKSEARKRPSGPNDASWLQTEYGRRLSGDKKKKDAFDSIVFALREGGPRTMEIVERAYKAVQEGGPDLGRLLQRVDEVKRGRAAKSTAFAFQGAKAAAAGDPNELVRLQSKKMRLTPAEQEEIGRYLYVKKQGSGPFGPLLPGGNPGGKLTTELVEQVFADFDNPSKRSEMQTEWLAFRSSRGIQKNIEAQRQSDAKLKPLDSAGLQKLNSMKFIIETSEVRKVKPKELSMMELNLKRNPKHYDAQIRGFKERRNEGIILKKRDQLPFKWSDFVHARENGIRGRHIASMDPKHQAYTFYEAAEIVKQNGLDPMAKQGHLKDIPEQHRNPFQRMGKEIDDYVGPIYQEMDMKDKVGTPWRLPKVSMNLLRDIAAQGSADIAKALFSGPFITSLPVPLQQVGLAMHLIPKGDREKVVDGVGRIGGTVGAEIGLGGVRWFGDLLALVDDAIMKNDPGEDIFDLSLNLLPFIGRGAKGGIKALTKAAARSAKYKKLVPVLEAMGKNVQDFRIKAAPRMSDEDFAKFVGEIVDLGFDIKEIEFPSYQTSMENPAKAEQQMIESLIWRLHPMDAELFKTAIYTTREARGANARLAPLEIAYLYAGITTGDMRSAWTEFRSVYRDLRKPSRG